MCLFYNFLNPLVFRVFSNFNIVSYKDNLLVHYINIGQGDSMAINLPDGKVMVIDCGPTSSSSTLIKYIDENVLSNSNKKFIDYLLLTHADADHTGGALKLVQTYDVGTVYLPVEIENYRYAATYTNFLNYVEKENIYTKFNLNGTKIEQNGYKFQFFGPIKEYKDTNDACSVIKLEFKNKSFLFTGDIPTEVEQELVAEFGKALDSDVLKVAHHGSKYSSCLEFLNVVTPNYSVISSGENNFGHPSEQAISNLRQVGSQVLRTDKEGNILFVVGKNYNLTLLTDDFTITSIIFDYRYLVLIIDAVILVNVVIIACKRTKNTKKTRKNRLKK